MRTSPVGTYLRFLRKEHGLSQRALAEILGAVSESQVSRHERSSSLPTILAALSYQVVFEKPVSEIFPGLYHAVELSIEERLDERARRLSDSAIDGPIREFIARRASRRIDPEHSE
jgi:transcriptional regulator with XRE-family HTH domain